MEKIKKVISKIGEMPISISKNEIKYYLNGIAYRTNERMNDSTKLIEFHEDDDFLYLSFSVTVIEDETEDTITVNKETNIELKYSKKSKTISVLGEGFTSGIDKFIKFKGIRAINTYSKESLRNFVFSILKYEPFYENLMRNIVIEDIGEFCISIIRLYLTDNVCILSFLSKFNLVESLKQLLSKEQENILCKLNESQETVIYKFCELFEKNKIDYLESVLYAENNLDKNEMELLYKFIESILKLGEILKKPYPYVNVPSVNEIIKIVMDIKILDVNLTLALNTICKDIFKNYNITNISKVLTDYRDYLAMLNEINGDKVSKYPANIILEHDKLVKRYNLIQAERGQKIGLNQSLENQKKVTLFKKAVSEYRYLSYENEKYKIIIPEIPTDLINEGTNLCHCVGSYIGLVTQKITQVLFCRRKGDINNSYMTIEVHDNKLVQAKKYKDDFPNEEDKVFLKEFCKKRNLKLSNY